MARGTMTVTILGDARGFRKELGHTEGKLDKFSSGINGWATKVAGAVAAAFAVHKIADFTRDVVGLASDTEESLNKVRVVFGDNAKAIEQWAGSAATNLGLSRQEALEAAGTFGNLFDAMGLGGDAATTMSKDVVGLAADLGSFNNLGTEEVLEKLRAGLVGEIEPLRSLGVSFNAADVAAKAAEMGLTGVNDALTEGEKVQARYALILEQTTNAQGDFANTSDGLANSQKILGAQFDDLKAQIGEKLLPVAEALVLWARDHLPQAFDAMKAWWDANGQQVVDTARTVWDGIVAGIQFVSDWVGKLTTWWTEHFGTKGTVVQQADGMMQSLRPIWDNIVEIVRGAVELARAIIDRVTATIRDIWSRFGDDVLAFAKNTWEMILQVVDGAIQAVRGVIDVVLGLIKGDWSRAWDGVKNIVAGIWDIIAGIVEGAIRNVLTVLGGVLEEIARIWSGFWEGVKDYASETWTQITEGVSGALGGMKTIVGDAVTAIASIWRGIANAFANPVNWIIDNVVNRFLGGIESIANALNFNISLPRIPRVPTFHDGGIVGEGGRMTSGPLRPGERMIKALDGEEVLTRDDPRHRRNLNSETDEIGGIGDIVGNVTGAVARTVRNIIGDVARPAVNAGIALAESAGARFGVPGQLVGGAARKLGEGVLDWITGVESKLAPKLSPGIGWQAMWEALSGAFPWARKTSDYRAGAITATGNPSYHASGRAIDVAGRGYKNFEDMGRIFEWIRDNYAAISKEIIYSPANSRQIWNGKNHMYGEVTRRGHWDHVHWAMSEGGIVRKPTYALIGERGPEAVIPLNRGGGFGGNITVNVHGVIGDRQEVAEWLRRELVRTARRNGDALGGLA